VVFRGDAPTVGFFDEVAEAVQSFRAQGESKRQLEVCKVA
jgi:hypothetical protein